MTTLAERCREMADELDLVKELDDVDSLLREAADELERLERERGEYRNHSHDLIIEVDRLRTALVAITEREWPNGRLVEFAREALAAERSGE
jgi:predicted nuclease with TOPRIM domain